MNVQIRQDLLDEGIEFVPTCDEYNEYVSAEQVAKSKFIECDDEGLVKLELVSGKIVTIYSIDLDFQEK